MLSSKKKGSPLQISKNRSMITLTVFIRCFAFIPRQKVAMSLIAMTAVGFSFYNLYEQWQDAEGKKDHIAVIRISGEMGTGSKRAMEQ